MLTRFRRRAVLGVFTTLWISCALRVVAQAPVGAPPMESAFRNIQVLRGVPSSELLPIMHLMRTSLGVRCDFCHIAEDGQYQVDTRPQKQRAREMILMTRRLNESAFGSRTVVTCNTCHHGSVTPDAVPTIEAELSSSLRRIPGEIDAAPLPSAADLFARFASLTRLESMPASRITVEGSHTRVVEPGTPRARALPRAAANDGEILIDGSRASTRSALPNGQFILVASDGARAWTSGPDGLAWVPAADFIAFQRRLNVLIPLRVGPRDFTSAVVTGVERLHNRETFVVEGIDREGTSERLWFDRDSGLLLRRTYYHRLAVGLDPEQFDFSEYMEFSGFRLPAAMNTSYLDDAHRGVLKRILAVAVGVPVTDADFAPPARRHP